MSFAEKYANKHGYQSADFMLYRIKDNLRINPNISTAIELSVQDAIITALRVIDESNQATGDKS